MESKIINKVMKEFTFEGRLASLQYWRYIQAGDNWGLTLKGQPFLQTKDHRALNQHGGRCLKHSDVLVRQADQEWLAGLAAQHGVAYQRTSRDRNQFWGQLVVPVYIYEDTETKIVGVIELATYSPERNYVTDFLRIQHLLEDKMLSTKAVTIKVKYKNNIIRFPLLSFGIKYLREEVTERFKGETPPDFSIKYVDRHNGNYIRISSDEDLRACITISSSLTIKMIIDPFTK